MKLNVVFADVKFEASTIENVFELLRRHQEPQVLEDRQRAEAEATATNASPGSVIDAEPSYSVKLLEYTDLGVSSGRESWSYDTIEQWTAAYNKDCTYANLSAYGHGGDFSLAVSYSLKNRATTVTVGAPNDTAIHAAMNIFNAAENSAKLPALPMAPTVNLPPVKVFIGHGGSRDWNEIADHLRGLHEYDIEAYETGSRSGHSIRDVLQSMLDVSTFAVLVLSSEDATAAGGMRARQNVVHEVGLFQGKLGFNRAIAVIENGAEVFSNLDGIQQIRYDSGQVRSTLGDILAALRREFGDRR
ncbi:TIR domain-containing protein [Arthrobacter psychrochitiniphilus]|uniref:CD-NTase-associated protein 12/Pycsar effector protein TIR domain-containing protein n=1 Tax=Arthrobacter psychrochitiniphilus TaxID=291045 RepID=A0A2V3DTZ3_9MICC|nr:nucleotide-binding protein [Arthrobacter psychrochitiniphilus]NYG16016.1 putative nucleotide-binding protein [Arthrobacter psychrochitiniphilus]PXA64028.1 hypothetical protein CVS29_17405 [Arthrobacter psychrochitiniphilus]